MVNVQTLINFGGKGTEIQIYEKQQSPNDRYRRLRDVNYETYLPDSALAPDSPDSDVLSYLQRLPAN